MTKDVGTQTNILFELLDYDYSLYHTDFSKTIILELKNQEYSAQFQELKRETSSLNTAVQGLKK